MEWPYFFFAELLFFILFLCFLLWQYLSLKRDKALLKAQREAEAVAAKSAKSSLERGFSRVALTKGCLPSWWHSVYKKYVK